MKQLTLEAKRRMTDLLVQVGGDCYFHVLEESMKESSFYHDVLIRRR